VLPIFFLREVIFPHIHSHAWQIYHGGQWRVQSRPRHGYSQPYHQWDSGQNNPLLPYSVLRASLCSLVDTDKDTAVPSSEITMGCTSPLAESSYVCKMRLTVASNSVRCHTTQILSMPWTTRPPPAPGYVPDSISSTKQPTPPIPASSVQRPVTYCVPTPKTDSSSSHFQPLAPTKPTLKDYPVTGSPAIRRLTDFDVHQYIGFCLLRDCTALYQVGTRVKVV
jgi:hypothetical protein